MRREFAKQLFKIMSENKDVILITGDLGYKMFDEIRDKLPKQFYNTGAAEQTMMGIAVGLSIEGKIPIVYSITPFLIYRPLEVIRNYIDHENLPIIMVGSGRDNDYSHDGFSHYAGDDYILSNFRNIKISHPENIEDINLENIINLRKPFYLNLKR